MLDGWMVYCMDGQTDWWRCVHGYMKKGAYNVAGQMHESVRG